MAPGMRAVLAGAVLLLATCVAAQQAPAAAAAAPAAAAAAPAATAEKAADARPRGRGRGSARAAELTNVVNPKSSLQALLDSNLNLYVKLVNESGFINALNSTALRATIFAPTDTAITKLAKEFGTTPERLFENQLLVDRLAALSVVVGADVASSALKNGQIIEPARGGNLTVSINKGAVTLASAQNNATVVKPDIVAGNVTIHIIDAVLLPNTVFPTLKAALLHKVITKSIADLAVKDAALSKAISNPKTAITLFVPAEPAVEKFLASGPAARAALATPTSTTRVLKYHAVPGARVLPRLVKDKEVLPTLLKGQTVTLQKVTAPGPDGKLVGTVQLTADSAGAKPVAVKKLNIIAGNSFMHVIDGVLVPKAT